VLLIWRMKLADMVIAVAAPIGVGFVGLSLVTGVLWGKPTWLQASDRWWVWDARTTSMLVLLFLYFGIIALRQSMARQESAGRACAVLAVVGLINIPIIKNSVDWWLTLHQPATFTLTEKPAMPAEMWLPLLFSALGFYVFFAAILTIALRTEILRREQRTQWVRDLAGGMPR
jgi:heme exporter protein C